MKRTGLSKETSSGQGTIEYVLLLLLAVAIALFALNLRPNAIATTINTAYQKMNDKVSTIPPAVGVTVTTPSTPGPGGCGSGCGSSGCSGN